MSWMLLAWHWLLGHALFAGGVGALVAMLASGPTGWAALRWLIGTRPGVLLIALWAFAAVLTWQKSVSFADGYAQGAARSSALIAASATAAAQAEARAVAAARGAEATRGRYVSGVDAAYQRGLRDAKATGDGVAAGLRSGALRLSGLWRGCEARLAAASRLPGAPASASGADAAADARADSAGRIIGAARAEDLQARCLQAIALIDRGQPPGDLAQGCPVATP